MKGNSPRALHRKRVIRVLAVGAAAGVVFFLAQSLLGYVFGGVMTLPYVVSDTVRQLSVRLPDYFKERSVLLSEIDDLQKKYAHESGTAVTILRLQKENEELLNLLGRQKQLRIMAEVIGRPPALPYDVLVINAGHADGVVLGAPVYSGIDQVIGVVGAVSDHNSVALLVTSPDFVASAYIVGPQIYTNAYGKGGGVLELRIPQGINVQTGDPVILPMVPNAVFGEITTVSSVPTEPEQYAYVMLPRALQSIRYVSVGTDVLQDIDFSLVDQAVASTSREWFGVDVPPERLAVVAASTTSSSTATSTLLATTTVSQ